MYLKEEITDQPLADVALKLNFVGIDLAPNDQLETGFTVINRDRRLLRLDKIYSDVEILKYVESVGPANSTVVVIDMPKSLSISGKWRQQELKMHPLRLERETSEQNDRYERRGRELVAKLQKAGYMAFLYFHYQTRITYDMLIPFRSRSPQGCRMLQWTIGEMLNIKNLPKNLAPSSVLESIVGAYAGWSVWAGNPKQDYKLFQDEEGFTYLIPVDRPHLRAKKPYRPKFRRRKLSFVARPQRERKTNRKDRKSKESK